MASILCAGMILLVFLLSLAPIAFAGIPAVAGPQSFAGINAVAGPHAFAGIPAVTCLHAFDYLTAIPDSMLLLAFLLSLAPMIYWHS